MSQTFTIIFSVHKCESPVMRCYPSVKWDRWFVSAYLALYYRFITL